MMMRTVFGTAGVVAAAVLAMVPAQAQDAAPAKVEIMLANFSFTPASIHLAAGKPVTLHFVNAGSGGHNFAAPEFFKAATISAGAGAVKDGKVELEKGAAADVTLTPTKGSYKAKCTHFLHAGMGMTGEIVVD
jgi:plastocyanin